MSFVHLHVHSQYSLLQATCRFEDMIERALASGMPALANTDLGNMFGAVEFYLKAQSKGIKPILGLEVYLAEGSRWEKSDGNRGRSPLRRLVLLAQNAEGYYHLCRLSSIGYKEGFYYKPRIDYEVLKKFHSGLICLSGGIMGEIPWTFQNKGTDLAIRRAQDLKKIFGDRFYLEMNRTGISAWDEINPFLQELSRSEEIPLVAANDVHYVNREDLLAQDVLICIGTNKTLQDESRFTLGSDQFNFKTADEMRALFQDIPEACDRTLEVAERCHFSFKLKDEEGKPIYHLPSYPTVGDVSLKEEIQRLSEEGLEKRFEEANERGEEISESEREKYKTRLDYELGVIDQMGFNGYFLIVQDFISWSKENGIPVGPGRGSGAGSIVAYSLGITDIDPMPYNLLFERFLNPERVSMPDFDVDFCQEHRQRVIDYVTEKYGEDSVSQIITYGRLQTRAAIRDVGRVLGMTFDEVDVVSQLIPDRLGITLQEAIDEEPRLREMMEGDPKIGTLIELALKVEGLVRHAGIHAAGVVIADGNIIDHAPVYRGADGENVVQYDMKHAEKVGLIKFDFLGLKTLTHIKDAVRLIKKNRGTQLDVSKISLKDKGIYEIICRGETEGIFQFEGEGISDLIRKAQPKSFEDIMVINALYRPGPMDMIPDYLDHRLGKKKVKYIFPELEEITKDTQGVIVYQEQVQLIASRIANYSLGEADILRRAMSKKIQEEMVRQKDRFLSGAKENGYDTKKAAELFDSMAEFAKYGFNKSHAAAYCVIAAQTAYLKNYYPLEFFAALLSTEMSDTDKVVKYVKAAQKYGIEVEPPNVSHSEYKFTVSEGKIFFSLGAIKGVGGGAVESILEARESMPEKRFPSLESFFESVDLRRINKKVIESLIKAGALDEFGLNRAELMKHYGPFVERAEGQRLDRERGQMSLFSLDEELASQDKVQVKKCSPWNRSSCLAYEKEVLGFYLSDHPLNGIKGFIPKWASHTMEDLLNEKSKSMVRVVGMVTTLREIITKKGTRMAFGKFEDLTGSAELVVFPDTFAEFEMDLKSEGAILVSGTLEREEKTCKILVNKIERVEKLLSQAKRVFVDLGNVGEIKKTEGTEVEVEEAEGAKIEVEVGEGDEVEAEVGEGTDSAVELEESPSKIQGAEGEAEEAEGAEFEAEEVEAEDGEGAEIEVEEAGVTDSEVELESPSKIQGAEGRDSMAVLSTLKKLCLEHPGSTSLILRVHLSDIGKIVQMEVKEPVGIHLNESFCEGLERLLGGTEALRL